MFFMVQTEIHYIIIDMWKSNKQKNTKYCIIQVIKYNLKFDVSLEPRSKSGTTDTGWRRPLVKWSREIF